VKEPARPADEQARLAALHNLRILDTAPEGAFEAVTAVAAAICGTPMALVSLVDADRQWFKSAHGIDADEMPRSISFCGHTILDDRIMQVPDTLEDDRFFDNPLVTGDPHLRFYAGAPLFTREGLKLGALCVLDREPRELEPWQTEALGQLAILASHQMAMRRQALDRALNEGFLRAAMDAVGSIIVALDTHGRVSQMNRLAQELLGIRRDEAIGRAGPDVLGAGWIPTTDPAGTKQWPIAFEDPSPPTDGAHVEYPLVHLGPSDQPFPARVTVAPIQDAYEQDLGFLVVANDVREVHESQERLAEALSRAQRQRDLHRELRDAQDEFISNPETLQAFDALLDILLRFSDSEYGFIGEVLFDGDSPYLKTHAITNIAWTDELRQFYAENAPAGLVFRNLETLFGTVMTTRAPVIANSPYDDPRRGGLPEGHPRMDAFLGLPIFSGSELIGMVGVANRPGGYDDDVVAELDPILLTYGSLVLARNDRISRRTAEESLRRSRVQLDRAIKAGGVATWDWDVGGRKVGGSWPRLLGYRSDRSFAKPEEWRRLVHPDDRRDVFEAATAASQGIDPLFARDFRMLAADGSWRWVSVTGKREQSGGAADSGAEGEQGSEPITLLTGTMQDIHDKRVIQHQSSEIRRNQALLQEVHHRIKNNLEIVSSLLTLQQNKSTSAEAVEQLSQSRDRIKAVARLHELLYRSDAFSTIELGQLARELAEGVGAAFRSPAKAIEIEVESDPLEISLDLAGSLSLILNELLSNAFKHAYIAHPRGLIRISIKVDRESGTGTIRVSDDGVGVDEAAKIDGSGSSLGMDLVHRLTQQEGATLTLVPTAIGTTWELRFPLEDAAKS
jgi:two-component sensor histidine kinase/GAF domain-containing protein